MLTTKAKQQFIIGIVGGIFISFLVRSGTKQLFSKSYNYEDEHNKVNDNHYESKPLTNNAGLILVGVQTAKKYLDTRMRSAYDTWVQHVRGDVIFFSGEESADYAEQSDIPLVSLPGVQDNLYPPQKKSFLMLKYMHDYFIDKYEWFVRADDDAFIIGPKLEKFLLSINSSKLYYIGQGGEGREEERGQLGLMNNIAYCMGGPGVILSRAVLAKVAPNIGYCLGNLFSAHEDTELGRCIYKFARISCTMAAEVCLFQSY